MPLKMRQYGTRTEAGDSPAETFTGVKKLLICLSALLSSSTQCASTERTRTEPSDSQAETFTGVKKLLQSSQVLYSHRIDLATLVENLVV